MIEAIFFVFIVCFIINLIFNSKIVSYLPQMFNKSISDNSNINMKNMLMNKINTNWKITDTI